MVSERQRERVLGYIEAGTADGAKLVAGGSIPKDQPRGWFVEPTVFADVANADRIAQEEIFGPVLAVIPYDGDDEAVALANDSEYGLGGTVWSTDAERATGVARAVRDRHDRRQRLQPRCRRAVRRSQGQWAGS